MLVQAIDQHCSRQQVPHAGNNLRSLWHADERRWNLRRLVHFSKRMQSYGGIRFAVWIPACPPQFQPECQLSTLELACRRAIVIRHDHR